MSDREFRGMGRRELLQGALGASVAAMAGPRGSAVAAAEPKRQPNLIQRENQRPGALDWQLTYVLLDKPNGFRTPWIEGYCSHQSIEAGQRLDFFVSVDPPAKYLIEIFRTGYYGGRGARLMTTIGPLSGHPQPLPPVGPRRLRECQWEKAASVTIPVDWPSGVYLGRLSRVPEADGTRPFQSYTVFIVRDQRPADILLQCSDNTWQSYNRWPDRFSLYDDGSVRDWSTLPDIDVSFDRPYGKYRQIYENPQSVGSGEWLCFEFPLAYWLEQHGYDVTYCSNTDMITPERGMKCKCFISAGHDEYWDVRAYHSVKAMIELGTSALFLSGNSVCWVTPQSPSADGRPNRTITRAAPYASTAAAFPDEAKRFRAVGPDEGLLMGCSTVPFTNGGGDWIVTKPEHWMFEGTGMKRGDRVRGLVGWEFHGWPAKIPGLEVVAEGDALHGGTKPVHWTATIYPGPKGNFVFSASTIFWAQGLASPPGHMLPWSHTARPHGPDDRVQRITQNLLRRAIG